jgi:hypothetical protein
MRNNPIIVQKYGGTCIETSAKIRAVASSLADLHSRGHRVVAIVSAIASKPHPNRWRRITVQRVCPLLAALFGHGATSDLSPLCGQEPTLAGQTCTLWKTAS